MLRLYSVNDGPHYRGRPYMLEWGELFWLAVWAENPSQVLEVYKMARSSESDAEDTDELTLASLEIESVGLPLNELGKIEDWAKPEQEIPHVEWRTRLLRECRWLIPDEHMCERCELYPMGLPEHSVCSWCYLCKGCRKWVNENEKDAEYCDECCPFLED